MVFEDFSCNDKFLLVLVCKADSSDLIESILSN